MGPMDILLLALLLLWAVLALRRMRRHGSCGCGSCTCSSCCSCSCCGSCSSFAQSSRRRTTSRRSVGARRSGGARREDPGDGAPLPFAKSENRTK